MRPLLRRFRLLVAGGLLLALPALAAPPVPLLWTVSKGEASVALLGSFHMLQPDDYPLDPRVQHVYEAADRIVFEVDPETMQSPDTARLMLEAAKFTDGRTLTEVLPEATRAKLEAFIGKAGVQGSNALQPWYLTVNLAVAAIVQAGFNPALGLDMHFMQRAAADAKATGGLETAEDQVRALAGAPIDEQVLGLEEVLTGRDEFKHKLGEMHAAWRGGDIDALQRLMHDELLDKTPVTARQVLTDRNARWLPQVEAMLARPGHTLVVVGAAHLLGPDGLVELLRRRGYRVERVSADAGG